MKHDNNVITDHTTQLNPICETTHQPAPLCTQQRHRDVTDQSAGEHNHSGATEHQYHFAITGQRVSEHYDLLALTARESHCVTEMLNLVVADRRVRALWSGCAPSHQTKEPSHMESSPATPNTTGITAVVKFFNTAKALSDRNTAPGFILPSPCGLLF